MIYWITTCYLFAGVLHCAAFFRRVRGVEATEWLELHWGWYVCFVVVCVLLWPTIPALALLQGYHGLFSRSRWAAEKRWEGWPLGDYGTKRYAAHEDLMGTLNSLRQQNERQSQTSTEASNLVAALRSELARDTTRRRDEFICDECWELINEGVLYGVIPWTRPTPEGATCTKCGCALPAQARHYPGDRFMDTLGAVGDVVLHDRETRKQRKD